jgi:hypothetical protein
MKSLLATITHTREHLHEELGLMIQGKAQMTKTLMDATRRGLGAKIAEVEAKCGRGTGTGAGAAKPTKFNGTTSWTVFWHQFETLAEYNCGTRLEKSIYLITAMQGHATHELHGVLKKATYEETLGALEDRFGDQHLAAAYRSQLKSRTQGVGESLQEFATAIEQLAHCAYPALPENHIRREAGKAFENVVQDPAIKIQLLLGREKMVDEDLRQAFELQAVLAARPPEMSARIFWGIRSPPPTRRSACWSYGVSGYFRGS